jgi:hypothetical protein
MDQHRRSNGVRQYSDEDGGHGVGQCRSFFHPVDCFWRWLRGVQGHCTQYGHGWTQSYGCQPGLHQHGVCAAANSDGNLYVFESGVNRGAFSTFTTADVFRVAVEGGVVKYRKNGTLLYTSTVTPTYPLLVDAGLYINGTSHTNVVISGNLSGSTTENVVWTNVVGATASGNTLTKTAATAWGNAGASSTRSIVLGDGYVEFKVTAPNTGMVGLSHTDANQDYTSMEFALLPNSDGNLYVFESGVNRGVVSSFTTSDVFRVAVEGGVVKYRKNGTLLYTSTVTPTYPLLVDAGLYVNGASHTNVVLSGNLTRGTGSG